MPYAPSIARLKRAFRSPKYGPRDTALVDVSPAGLQPSISREGEQKARVMWQANTGQRLLWLAMLTPLTTWRR